MAISIKKWILEKLGDGKERDSESPEEFQEMIGMLGEVHIRELAFWSCVNLIANAVSKCEFKTFVNKQEKKRAEYYLWNIEPNKNQNSSAFIHKWISKLYQNNEALIIEQNGQLLIADSFVRKPYALYEDSFSQVTIGDFTFNNTFKQSQVLYFQLSQKDMRQVTARLYQAYEKLISYSMKSFTKSRGNKGILQVDTVKSKGKEDHLRKLQNEYFRDFFTADNAVLPLFNGYEYTDLGSKTYSNEGTRDIRAMVDDISDFTARGFGIPPVLLNGTVQGITDALDQFLTFCIDPLCDMLQEEINRKRNGFKGFSKGCYLKIDTKSIKHIDLLSVSAAVDKLISSGAFCVNDIRETVGEEPIAEDWANQHFMTKNYTAVTELLNAMEEEQV